MPTDFTSRANSSAELSTKLPQTIVSPSDWRCRQCSKLLGVRRKGRLHISLQGHDYTVSFPVEAKCRCCGCMNRADIDQAR